MTERPSPAGASIHVASRGGCGPSGPTSTGRCEVRNRREVAVNVVAAKSGTSEDAAAAEPFDGVLDDDGELLVEEVSIDGMCGVY
jgi:mycofactocin precursor